MAASSSSSSSHQIRPLLLLVFILFILDLATASALISDAVVGNQVVNGRRLLQAKKPCPLDIENQNYTIITSQCKGPNYPPEPCCSSLTEFACPLKAQLNDLSNDCSERMFSYIQRQGQYPPGLFSSICRGDKDGLPCPAAPPSPTPNGATNPMLLGRGSFIVLLSLFLFELGHCL